MTRQEYVDMLKSAVVTATAKSLTAAIITQVPFLTPFRFIIDALTERLMGFIIGRTEMGIFILYVDLRTNAKAKDFEAAAMRNFLAQKSGDIDAIKKAELELIESFRNFAKFTR